MNINELIAARMGWEKNNFNEFFIPLLGWTHIYFNDTPKGNWIASLIRKRIVDEGYTVKVVAFRNGSFEAEAILPHSLSLDSQKHSYLSSAETEPEAIFALACNVWGLEEQIKLLEKGDDDE